jgi:hypothetical protein
MSRTRSPRLTAVFSIIAASALPRLAEAQEQRVRAGAEEYESPFRYQAIGLSVGATGLATAGPLNAALTHEGYGALPSLVPSFDVSVAIATYSAFLFGCEYRFLGGRTDPVELYGHQAFFDIGALLYSSTNFAVYPVLGVGLGIARLDVHRTKDYAGTLAGTLRSPAGDASLTQFSFTFQGGLAADFVPDGGPVLFGLRAGATFAPVHGAWKRDQTDLAGLPAAPAATMTIGLAFGWGVIARRKTPPVVGMRF